MDKKEKKLIRDLKGKKREKKQIERLDYHSTQENLVPKEELKETKRRNRKPHGTLGLKNSSGNIIDVTNMSKTYVSGKTMYKALDDVSFSIKKGEIVAILGPSGSGKSTLLNVISGLDRSTSGDVVVNDYSLAALSNKDLTTFRRNNVGFIFQSYNLLPELNAADNAELGRALQIDGAKRADINELFNKIGIGDRTKSPINELSGGQMQRVSIARALAKGPEIIFADEPTGALDSKSSEHVLDLFLDINKQFKTTIVLVTHDNDVAKLAHRILMVDDGKVAFKNGI